MSSMDHNVLAPLEPFLVDIDMLTPDPANARQHNVRNLDSIMNSLKAFGQHQPIIVQKDNMIVRIGNGRVAAAKKLGWTKIAALVVDENNVDSISRAIADNRTAELASWDFDVLGDLFRGLQGEGADLTLTGFADYELEPLLQTEWSDSGTGSEDTDAVQDAWKGMPEFEMDDLTPYRTVKVHLANQADVDSFAEWVGSATNQTLSDRSKYIWYPEIKKVSEIDHEYNSPDEVV